MAEPDIRYCTTSDGASIAYAAMGAGPVVIMLPSVHSFAARMRLLPEHRALCDAIAERFTLLQYDGRGMGLSARELTHSRYSDGSTPDSQRSRAQPCTRNG